MKLKVMTIHVDDQAKALRFYTEVLGLKKKTDVSNHGYRWVTVASPSSPTVRSCSSRPTPIPWRRPTRRRGSRRASRR